MGGYWGEREEKEKRERVSQYKQRRVDVKHVERKIELDIICKAKIFFLTITSFNCSRIEFLVSSSVDIS